MKHRMLRDYQWKRIKDLLPGKVSELPAAGRLPILKLTR